MDGGHKKHHFSLDIKNKNNFLEFYLEMKNKNNFLEFYLEMKNKNNFLEFCLEIKNKNNYLKKIKGQAPVKIKGTPTFKKSEICKKIKWI